MIVLYQRIRHLREDADLTQSRIARELGCSQQVYSNYELDRRMIPIDALVRLAQFYETSVDYLVGLTDVRTPYPRR